MSHGEEAAVLIVLAWIAVTLGWPDIAAALRAVKRIRRRRRLERAAGPKPRTPSPAFLEGDRWVVACPWCRHPGFPLQPGVGCPQCLGYGTLPTVTVPVESPLEGLLSHPYRQKLLRLQADAEARMLALLDIPAGTGGTVTYDIDPSTERTTR